MDEHRGLDDAQKKVVLDALTKWVKEGVKILLERRINRDDPILVKEALRDAWEEMVLEVIHGLGEPLAVFIWVTNPPSKNERDAQGKDYSLDSFKKRVLAQFEERVS